MPRIPPGMLGLVTQVQSQPIETVKSNEIQLKERQSVPDSKRAPRKVSFA